MKKLFESKYGYVLTICTITLILQQQSFLHSILIEEGLQNYWRNFASLIITNSFLFFFYLITRGEKFLFREVLKGYLISILVLAPFAFMTHWRIIFFTQCVLFVFIVVGYLPYLYAKFFKGKGNNLLLIITALFSFIFVFYYTFSIIDMSKDLVVGVKEYTGQCHLFEIVKQGRRLEARNLRTQYVNFPGQNLMIPNDIYLSLGGVDSVSNSNWNCNQKVSIKYLKNKELPLEVVLLGN